MSQTIPYTVEARPDTGLNNGQIGMWLFLASEVMLFGSLFAGYIILRVGSEVWPHGSEFGLSIPLASINTLVLLSSSVTSVMARTSLVRKDVGKFRFYLLLTVLGGLLFCGIKTFEYWDKFHHGHVPSTHNFLAIYFTLTGLHTLHVVVGVAVNSYLLGPGFKLWGKNPQQFIHRVEASGLYWHFVDLVWILLFLTLYLL